MRLTRDDLLLAAQGRAARLAVNLPGVPSGRAGRTLVDGQGVDRQVATLIAVEAKLQRPGKILSLDEQRESFRSSAKIAAGTPIKVGPIRDLTVTGAAGHLKARHYTPPTLGIGRPLLVFFHGGGWVKGDLDSHDQPCRLLARYADMHVLSIDYRLAPEHVFPAAVEDAIAAFAWAVSHAETLGADPTRVVVGGDSAGGNLAAVVAHSTRDSGAAQPAAQLLIYAGTHVHCKRTSRAMFDDGFFLDGADIDWYWDRYSDDSTHPEDPRHSPLLAGDFRGLAPAVVATAAFDPLRDQGEAYAAKLRAAGVPVAVRRAQGQVHGYFSMTGLIDSAWDESVALAGAFAALVDATSPPQGPSSG